VKIPEATDEIRNYKWVLLNTQGRQGIGGEGREQTGKVGNS